MEVLVRNKPTPRKPRRRKHVPEGFAWPLLDQADAALPPAGTDSELPETGAASAGPTHTENGSHRRTRGMKARRGAAICGCIALVGAAGAGLAGALGLFDGSIEQPDAAPLVTPSATPSPEATDHTPTPSERPSSTEVPSPSTTPSVLGPEDTAASTQVPLLPGTQQQWTIGTDQQATWNVPGHTTVTRTPTGSSSTGTGNTSSGGSGHQGSGGGSNTPKPGTGGQTGGQTDGGQQGSDSGGSPSGQPSTGGGEEPTTDPTTPGTGEDPGTDPTEETPSDPPPDPAEGQE